MQKTFFLLMVVVLIFIIGCSAYAQKTGEDRIVPVIMTVTGLGIAAIWTADIISGKTLDTSNGFLRARNPESNALMWPHWTAEYVTAAGLLLGAYGLFSDKSWGKEVALVSIGALAYTSINSLSWSLAEKERIAYAIPMLVSLTGACISLAILF